MQYFGMQDAARKRRLDEGPWDGGIYLTSDKMVIQTVTRETWLKARAMIKELEKDPCRDLKRQLSYKRLERVLVCVCHMAILYDSILPYLKDFHLTLAGHLPCRDEEGWKMAELEWIGHL